MAKLQWVLKSGKVIKKNEAAVAAFNGGNQQQALALLDESLSIYEEYDRTHQLKGDLLTEMGQWQLAEACYQRALQINPQSVETLLNYGTLLHKGQRVSEAQERFTTALSVDPQNPTVLFNLGVLCRDRGMFSEAEQYFRQGLASPKLSAVDRKRYQEQFGLN